MTKQLLTDAIVRRLPTPEKGDAVYRDTKVRGLAIRVLASGTRTWTLTYFASGRRHLYAIGKFPEWTTQRARAMGTHLKEQVRHHAANPVQEAKTAREEMTVKELCDQYVKDVANRLARTRDLKNAIAHDIEPRLGAMKVSEVTRDEVQRLHALMTKRAPRRADQVLGLLRRMYKLANIAPNPTDGVPKNGQRSRDRVLDTSELVAVWTAADAIGFPFGPITKLLVLTGQRRSEIAELRWDEIDLRRQEINLPPSRTKNRKPHTIPLSAPAVEILAGLPHPEGAELVFSTTGETAVSGFSRAKRNMDRLSKIMPWRLHDIRRSVASHMSDDDLGIDVTTVERLLNHISGTFGGIVAVYNRAKMEKRKRQAVDAWSRYVVSLISEPRSAEVISLEKRRA